MIMRGFDSDSYRRAPLPDGLALVPTAVAAGSPMMFPFVITRQPCLCSPHNASPLTI